MKINFNRTSLISFHFEDSSVHLGVYRDPNTVYKMKGDREVEVDCDWIWGRATEQYDHCLEYFGLGPFMLVCWLP